MCSTEIQRPLQALLQCHKKRKNPDCFQRKINGCGIHVRLDASKGDALVLDFCYGLNGEQGRGSAGR